MTTKYPGITKFFLAAAPVIVMFAGFTRGFFDSSIGYPDADRILMDGVFIADFLHDFPINQPFEYALKYYVQYPALSIGYRPPFFPFIEALFFLVFGIYSWAGRLALIALALVGGTAFFLLLNRMYGRVVASIASTLLASLPFLVQWSWYTMAELPALSMMLVTAYFIWRYGEGHGDRFVYLSAAAFALTLWTKQTAAFMLLWLLPYVLLRKNWRHVSTSRSFWGAAVIFLILTTPLALMTLWLGDLNIGQSFGDNPRGQQLPRWHWQNLTLYFYWLFSKQLTFPVLVLSAAGLFFALRRKDPHLLFFAFCICSVFLFFTALNDPHLPRYTIFWLPAFCVFAALPWIYLNTFAAKSFYASLVVFSIAFNIYATFSLTPQRVSGFDLAAKFVVQQNQTPAVLVDARNNGYFTFFVRQNDPQRKIFVMRGDKLFSSSAIESTTWLTVHARSTEDILSILDKNKIDLIVVEERDYTNLRVHNHFREMLKQESFALRQRIPIESNLPRYIDQHILIYEYIARSSDSQEQMELLLPIVGKKIRISTDGKSVRLLPINH